MPQVGMNPSLVSSSIANAPLLTLPSRQPSITPGTHDRVAPSGLSGSGRTSLAFERVYTGKRVLASVSVIHLVMSSSPQGPRKGNGCPPLVSRR
jgi:hypothetical protein